MEAESQPAAASVHSYYIFVQNIEKYENKRKNRKKN